MVMKKSLFEHFGYFNPYYRYTHDYEVWFRLLVNGLKLLYLDEVLILFRQQEDSDTNKYQLEFQKEMAVIERHYLRFLKRIWNG